MKRYLFTVYLTGIGDNEDEAWIDATSSADLESDPTPDKDDWRFIEDDYEE